MKALALALAAAAAAGCSTSVEKPQFDELDQKFEKFRVETINKNDLQVHLYNDLVSKHDALQKKVSELETKVKLMEDSVARMDDLLKTASTPRPASSASDPAPQAPVMKPEDILMETEKNLTLLRAGKVKTDDVVKALAPYARITAPRLVEELGKVFTQVDYAKQLESILAQFPPAELKVPLQRALANTTTRVSAARIAGQAKDRELSMVLVDFISTPDPDFALSLGEALTRCRNAAGLPLLVRCLSNEESATRTIAIDALKRVNNGKDFGYRAAASPEENQAAIKLWEEWLAKYGKNLFENN